MAHVTLMFGVNKFVKSNCSIRHCLKFAGGGSIHKILEMLLKVIFIDFEVCSLFFPILGIFLQASFGVLFDYCEAKVENPIGEERLFNDSFGSFSKMFSLLS